MEEFNDLGNLFGPSEDKWANECNKEPEFNCPKCNKPLHTEWVDNGFGPYAVQASPYICDCGWAETGCPAGTCIREKCFSWDKCQGRAAIQIVLKPKEYRCARCHNIYETDWTEEEANAEYEKNFGKPVNPDTTTMVCEDCYREMLPFVKALLNN